MHGGLIADLAVVTLVGAITALLTRRLGQPSILGYLFAGLIVGPYIPVPLFADPHRMEELAEVGVVLVMFAVGLEFRIGKLLEILPLSGLTAAVQMGALGWAGFTVGSLLGWSAPASICLGSTLAISSTMVVSGVLRTRPVDPDIRSHVFGVLVVQDLAAIVLMAVVTALASGQSVELGSLGLLIGQLAGAVVAMLLLGLLVLPRLVRYALAQADAEVLVVLIAGAAFGLALVAEQFGYSVALGAFLAGMAVAESGRGHEVEEAIEPLKSLFSAVFFVSIGMTVDPVVAFRTLPLALGLCAVVIGMQFASVLIGTVLTGGTLRRGVVAGLALGQIGELSFILATIAIAGGVVPAETLPALVTVATVTAFTTPLLLGRHQAVIDAVDRVLPAQAHRILAVYQAFVRGLAAPGDGPPLRRPAIAVALDWIALVVLFIAREAVLPRVDPSLYLAVNLGAAALAVPFLLGLVRSGTRLATGVHAVARAQVGGSPIAPALEAIALLAVVLGVGLPTLALIAPLVDGPWVEVALLASVVASLVLLASRLGRVPTGHTSGVAQLALEIADQLQSEAPPPPVEDPLTGLDYELLTVRAGGSAAGRTLAQLDLRCVTGATVVSIRRGEQATLLPTGSALLQADDVLAVSGASAAVDRVRAILEGEGVAGNG